MEVGTWEITIERHDGSRYHYAERYPREPVLHELIETSDPIGRTIRAKISVIIKHPPKLAGLSIFQISAQEID